MREESSGQGPTPQPPGEATTVRRLCHRVKNDLQTILNLLLLAQVYRHTPQELADAVQKRVAVIGSAYAMVADSGRMPSPEALLRDIACRAAARVGVELSLVCRPMGVPLHLRLCTPLALWIGEIIDNSLAHGVIGGCVALRVDGGLDEDGLRLRIADNGPGLPPGFSREADGGLGLLMAGAIAQRDLGGSMDLAPAEPGLAAALFIPRAEFDRLNND